MEHRLGLAGRDNASLESVARATFRLFTHDTFYEAYKPCFDKDAMLSSLDFEYGPLLDKNSSMVYERFPDVIILRELLWHLDFNVVLKSKPELHRILLNSPE